MNYHILKQAKDRKTINVVFHIPIPGAGSNEAGLSWPDAVVLELGGADEINSVLPNIDAGELTAMKAGELYELSTTVRFSSINLTNVQKKDEIEAAFTAESTKLIEEKQITLDWIGKEGDI